MNILGLILRLLAAAFIICKVIILTRFIKKYKIFRLVLNVLKNKCRDMFPVPKTVPVTDACRLVLSRRAAVELAKNLVNQPGPLAAEPDVQSAGIGCTLHRLIEE